MHVFDGDPNKLEWRSGSGESTVIAIYDTANGLSKKHALSGKRPPTDDEFSELVQTAKGLSERDSKPIYLVLFRIRNGLNDRFTTFGEFSNGKLSAFCRPPWRRGQGIF